MSQNFVRLDAVRRNRKLRPTPWCWFKDRVLGITSPSELAAGIHLCGWWRK